MALGGFDLDLVQDQAEGHLLTAPPTVALSWALHVDFGEDEPNRGVEKGSTQFWPLGESCLLLMERGVPCRASLSHLPPHSYTLMPILDRFFPFRCVLETLMAWRRCPPGPGVG